MSQSPLRRNRRFERLAIPILLVLLVVVLGRQLRAAATSNDRCERRVERLVVVDGERHEVRHRGHRHDHDFDFDHDVDVEVEGRVIEVRIAS